MNDSKQHLKQQAERIIYAGVTTKIGENVILSAKRRLIDIHTHED